MARASFQARYDIKQPFREMAEKELNVDLGEILDSCFDENCENLEIYRKNREEKYDPISEKVDRLASKKYIESFSDNPDFVLQDIQKILDVLEKQDFLESPERKIYLRRLSEAEQVGDKLLYSLFHTMCLESAFNCISFMIFEIREQIEVMKAYGNIEKIFDPIKEKILEWYSFSESEIATAFQDYLNKYVKQPTINVVAKKLQSVPFPLDKASQLLFRSLEAGTYSMPVEKSGSNDSLNTIFTIDFEELENSKALTFRPLTPFDKRVYVVIGALWDAGNEYMTIQQIHRAMGGKGSPASYQIKEIDESISKLMRTTIKIDNQEESEAYNYPHFVYDSAFLPAERVQKISINNRPAKYAIHLFREPPLLTFARQRKQITTYTPEQYALPFSLTEDNISLDDYFRSRIARMKRDKEKKKPYNNKMLYATIYDNCGINTKMKRSRAIDKFRKLLDHYQTTGMIAGYQERQDGIIIIL